MTNGIKPRGTAAGHRGLRPDCQALEIMTGLEVWLRNAKGGLLSLWRASDCVATIVRLMKEDRPGVRSMWRFWKAERVVSEGVVMCTVDVRELVVMLEKWCVASARERSPSQERVKMLLGLDVARDRECECTW